MQERKTFSIADQVFEQLEKDILSGKYPIGQILSENGLSKEFEVSRTPIREAIKRLEQENLLEESAKGYKVTGISMEDMKDMYEIRIEIEGKMAARCAKVINEEQLRELKDILDLQSFYTERQIAQGSDNSDNIKNVDTKFHELIYTFCGSRVYKEVLEPMHKKMTKIRKESVARKERTAASLKEHTEIYEALAAHDAQRAEMLMKQHDTNARNSAIRC